MIDELVEPEPSAAEGRWTCANVLFRVVRQAVRRALIAVVALLVLGFSGATLTARAGTADYAFELVDQEVRQGYGTEVTVRLVHKPTGIVVPDAIVFISRIDMSPDGMGDMTAPLDPVADTLPGYYRFETDLVMEGKWELTLAAKVPGEEGPVRARLVLQVVS